MTRLLLGLCWLLPSLLLAQDELFFPDTLHFVEPVDETLVISADKVGVIHSELPELQASVIETEGPWYGSRYVLAVKAPAGFVLLPITGDDHLNVIEVSAEDVLGNGHLQAVVRTMHYLGHTGWVHAIHERDWRVRVWDLQARRCVLDLTTGYSSEEWTNHFVPDSTGLLPYEERAMLSSEGEAFCETYEPGFAPKELVLLRTDDCPMDEGGLDLPSKAGQRIVYRLDGTHWLKQ